MAAILTPKSDDEFFEEIFEEWITTVFDHPVDPDNSWWWAENAKVWDAKTHGELTLRMMARLFEDPEQIINRFTPQQIDQGIWFIVDTSCSDHFLLLKKERLPLALKKQVIEGIFTLYSKLFSRICDPVLDGHGAANSSVYMFWDLAEDSRPEDPTLDAASLDVMARTLGVPHVACQQGALHGLGHWQARFPNQVQAIIDAFLERSAKTDEALKAYALKAREGAIQ
jgi:hypothetical protein